MKNYWMAATVALVLTTGNALSQSATPERTRATDGPAGSIESAHAGIVVDGSGAVTGTTDTFKKSQSYTSEDGQLSAQTHIRTTGPTTSIDK